MRILYHHRTLGDGAEGIHIEEMVAAFRQLGHTVRMVGPATSQEQVVSNIPQSRFSSLKKLIRGPAYECLELGYNILGYASMVKAIKEFKPDFIYDRYITYNYSIVGIGRQYKIPVFLEVNSPLAYERAYESDEELYFKNISHSLEKKITSDSFKTIVVSTPLKRYLVSMGVPPDHILVLPNGVNLQNFFPIKKSQKLMEKLNIAEDSLVLGFTGILRPWHGLDILIESFCNLHKLYPHLVLLLVGDGSVRSEIQRTARRMGCDKALKITGRIPHPEVTAHIGLFDIAVSPKTTFYASPMKIPEYMAMGKPVVAPDTENIHDLIQNQHSGLLFEPENADALSLSLKILIADKKKREAIGLAGLAEVQTRLNWQNTAQTIVKTYHKNR